MSTRWWGGRWPCTLQPASAVGTRDKKTTFFFPRKSPAAVIETQRMWLKPFNQGTTKSSKSINSNQSNRALHQKTATKINVQPTGISRMPNTTQEESVISWLQQRISSAISSGLQWMQLLITKLAAAKQN